MQENQSREPQTILQYLEAIKKQNQKQIELLTDIRRAALFFHAVALMALMGCTIVSIIRLVLFLI